MNIFDLISLQSITGTNEGIRGFTEIFRGFIAFIFNIQSSIAGGLGELQKGFTVIGGG